MYIPNPYIYKAPTGSSRNCHKSKFIIDVNLQQWLPPGQLMCRGFGFRITIKHAYFTLAQKGPG